MVGRQVASRIPTPLGHPSPLARVTARVVSMATRTAPPAVFTALGTHARLFRAWLPFGTTLLLAGRLPRRDAELVILRTAWTCNGWYEWTQHVDLAVRAGLTPSQVAGVPVWRAHADFTDRQRTLLLATDELLADRVVCDSTLAELREHLDPRQLVELCLLVGHYEMLAMALNTLGVTPDEGSMRRAPDEARNLADHLRDHLAVARSDRREPSHEANGDSPWNARSGASRS